MHSLDELLSRLHYERHSGTFRRITPTGKLESQKRKTGSLDKDGYIRVKVDAKHYSAHRLVWLFEHGSWPKHQIDHINGVKTDNRISNLRDVKQVVNMHNIHAPSKASSTGIRGVCLFRGRFIASISICNKNKVIGKFTNAEDARKAYLQAKNEVQFTAPNQAPEVMA